jgi:multiple sugar transport system permease protein
VVRGVLLAIVAAWTLFPIYYMVSLAITPWSDLFRPVYFVTHPTLDNFKFVLFQQSPFVKYFWRWLANSLFVSGAVMVAVLVVAAMGSFALGRIRFGLGRLVSGMTLFTYIIPASFLSIPSSRSWGTTTCSTPTGRSSSR